jgi:phosphoglycerate dehydrogenase-like enzyme
LRISGTLGPVPASTPPQRPIRAAVIEPAYEAMRERAPEGVEVELIGESTDLEAADFIVPGSVYPELLKRLPDLSRVAVIQVLSAGTDWAEPYVPPQATLCSARGARDASVAEWIMGALLGTTSQVLQSARRQTWVKGELEDLEQWTVVVVGMGSIGRRLERYLSVLGPTVIGVASRARDDLHGVDELPQLLPRADAVVVLAPLSDATRGLIGAAELAAMHDGALVINAARGAVVDTDALVAEVTTGRLRAVLDVTDPEPLPDGHPLWSAPGVLSITPHLAGDSAASNARAAALAGDQLVRFCAGEELRNIVRRGTG